MIIDTGNEWNNKGINGISRGNNTRNGCRMHVPTSGCSDHKCRPYLPAVWNSKWQNWQLMLISKSVSNWAPVESPHHRVCQCCQSHRNYYLYCVGIPLAYPQPLAGICSNWCIGNTMRNLEGPSILTNELSLHTLVVWVRALYWSLHNDKVSGRE